ncbi:hypothetical protein CBS101457_002879 [Exobasidium rhododendri]|nr:hypothetical protein CBS101457_002879 [Exobasidium rhododendri]
MLNRAKSTKDIRSRIKHENVNLGAGAEMGGVPNNRGLHDNAFVVQSSGKQAPVTTGAHRATPSVISNHSTNNPLLQMGGIPRSSSGDVLHNQQFFQQQQQQQQQQNQQQHSYYQGGDPRHQPHPLGAGPSFVSLSPSDSVSNFEGRPGGMMTSMAGQLFEPSAGSTASFAQALNDPSQPLRPARSGRRPQQQSYSQERDAYPQQEGSQSSDPSMSSAGRNLLNTSSRRQGQSASTKDYTVEKAGPVDRHGRSARLMAQVVKQDDGRATPNSLQSEDESGLGHTREEMHEPQYASAAKSYDSQITISPPLGSLSRQEEPAALSSVLNALTQAGRKKGQARIMRGTTAEEESKRRKSERKVEMARSKDSKPLEHYIDRQDERSFREICAVLRKVQEEWGFVVEDDFNSVALALSLLDGSSIGASKMEFEEIKELIERALQGTVDDHHESFATAISLHNNVLSSLGSAQNGVSAARRRLRDSKEALGAKRADLVQLWHRSQVVKDNLRLLDTIDNLKGVPDRLESLMSEKRFLEAVNLLMRSLKMVEKSEIAEVGATADLRGYLKGQEQAMFDILIEELHNHLYLKSFYCDARWKAYTPGQNALPILDFGKDYERGKGEAEDHDEPSSTEKVRGPTSQEKPLKLFQYLKSLADRPSFDPNLATDMPDLSAPNGLLSSTANPGTNILTETKMTSSQSMDSNLAAPLGGGDSAEQFQSQNPEADSFLYIEMLLESLARLGKLKVTQEIIQQRLTTELHQLVDSTIEEVDSRNELLRRSSVMVMRPESVLLSNASALARSFAESTRNSFRSSSFGRFSTSFGTAMGSSSLRLSTLESNRVERDGETMRDLFWTLFSKLEAVLEGHRVIFEVVKKISSRGASSAYKAVKIGKPSSLLEIWRPIQAEVRTLLYEHLMDDAESTSARRNVTISVNEVLRQGTFQRDRNKPIYKLVADSAPKAGVNVSRKDFAPLRRHEEALTNALRASVPGLVGAVDSNNAMGTSVSIANFQQQQSQAAFSSTSLRTNDSSFASSAGHKLLVKPDAFNISVLFQPALAFIERVKILLPPEASGESDSGLSSSSGKGFSRFLDEFVKDVFLSQLEDKVHGLLTTAVGGPDAFQEDVNSKGKAETKPIVRSAANVIVLIDSLYSMLRTTPFQRESYSHLIIQTIVQYYQQCHEKFRDLISSSTTSATSSVEEASTGLSVLPTVVLSAKWAQTSVITDCLIEALHPDCDPVRRKQLFDLENKLETNMASSTSGTINLSDLTTSRKKLMALGNLQNSMLWFYEHIRKLKATEEDIPTAPSTLARLSVISKVKPPALSIREAGGGGGAGSGGAEDDPREDELKLPLRKEMAVRFDALPKTFEHLSHVILFTLRLEIRARTIHYLDLAVNEGNYMIEDAVLEPDPQIVDLNAELASLDDIFTDTLLPEHHSFLFAGLASLMDLLLCQAVRKIRYMNRHGLTKMIRNILALQQSLRNIVVIHESQGAWGFEKSTKLWELIGKEPEEMMKWIKTMGPMHSFDDYRAALNLMLGIENGGCFAFNSTTNGGGTTGGPILPGAHLKPGTTNKISGDVSRQKLNEYLIELHEVAGDAL